MSTDEGKSEDARPLVGDSITDGVADETAKAVRQVLTVSRMYKRGGETLGEDVVDESVEVAVPDRRVPLASVSYGGRMTINMGNFESVQVSCDVTLPSYPEELPDAYLAARRFVERRLAVETEELRELRKSRSAK